MTAQTIKRDIAQRTGLAYAQIRVNSVGSDYSIYFPKLTPAQYWGLAEKLADVYDVTRWMNEGVMILVAIGTSRKPGLYNYDLDIENPAHRLTRIERISQ